MCIVGGMLRLAKTFCGNVLARHSNVRYKCVYKYAYWYHLCPLGTQAAAIIIIISFGRSIITTTTLLGNNSGHIKLANYNDDRWQEEKVRSKLTLEEY